MAPKQDGVEELFPENHVQDVFVHFSGCASAILKSAKGYAEKYGYRVALDINRRLLYLTVVSAYYDIARYKTFHFAGDHTKKSDGVKRAAYFTKWTIRFRPIQCVFLDDIADADIESAWVLMLNEHLALEWGSQCLANDGGLPGIRLSGKFRNDLLYTLHYREMNVDGLLSIYQMLSDTIKSKQKSPLFEIPMG